MDLETFGNLILAAGIISGGLIFAKCNCDYLPEKKDLDND